MDPYRSDYVAALTQFFLAYTQQILYTARGDDSMKDLGRYIKEHRKQRGFTQKQLGLQCGLSDATIQRLEGGLISRPACNNLCKIADALNIRRFHLLRLAGYAAEEDISSFQNIHGLADLSDEDMNELQLFIDFLLYRKHLQKGGTE